MTQLDYSSLSQPVTQTDIQAYKATRNAPALKLNKWLFGIIIAFGVITVGVTMMPLLIGLLAGNMNTLPPLGSFVVVVTLLTVIVVAWMRYDERKRAMLYRFAMQNKLTLLENVVNPVGYKSMIFDEGHSRIINDVLRLPDGAEIGNYEYTTGSGRSSTTHTYGYIKIPLTRNLPHMVLDGKANNLFGIITGLSDSFDRSQKLSLEGDFDSYFTLYVPKEYEQDALYVFTPDVMKVLVDEGRRFDMEIVDDALYVYSNFHLVLTSTEQLSSLVKIIDTIGSELRAQTLRYADERVDDTSQAGTIAQGGRRLNRRMSLAVLAALGIITVNIVLSMFDAVDSPVATFIYVAAGIGVWVVFAIGFLSRIKK